MRDIDKIQEIITKQLELSGYPKTDAWFVRGNIIRELRLSGFEIIKK